MKITTDYKEFGRVYVYDDLWTQMNNGAKCSVINIVEILMDIKWYGNNFKAPISMKGPTSATIIVPAAQDLLRVQANTKKEYIDISCF